MPPAARINGYTISHETLEEMRFMAIRMFKQGMRVENIASGMRLNRSTVFGWVHKYREDGIESLQSTNNAGAPSTLKQNIGRTWTFPEVMPVVRVSGKKGIHAGVTSAISPKGHLVFQFAKENINSAASIRFMKTLHNYFKNVKSFLLLIVPLRVNKKWLSDLPLIILYDYLYIFLPSYSPELNPDEEVWNYSKTKRLTARPIADKQQLKSQALGTLRSLQQRAKRIKSFFEK